MFRAFQRQFEIESSGSAAGRRELPGKLERSILAKRKPVVRVSRHLENEITVTPFVNRFDQWRLPDWQSTQDKRSGTESQVLFPFFPFQPD
jgi:hypothetical protein